MNYETSLEIELAIANWFGIQKYVIVPNLSYALLPYECDLAILSKAGYLYEIEIKVSRSDLIRDKKKHKWNYDTNKIKKLWFAIPEKLEDVIELIPEKAGILIVKSSVYVSEIKKPQTDNLAQKMSERQQFTIARVGAMRIWALKEALIKKSKTPPVATIT